MSASSNNSGLFLVQQILVNESDYEIFRWYSTMQSLVPFDRFGINTQQGAISRWITMWCFTILYWRKLSGK